MSVNSVMHAFRALEYRDENRRERLSRHNAIFDITKHGGKDALVDELCEAFAHDVQRVMDNFQAGDDLENGRLIAKVILQLSERIHDRHPEDGHELP